MAMGGSGTAAAVVTGHSLPKAKSRQGLCPGLLPFSSPLVLLHVLTKPVRVIPKIVLATCPLSTYLSIRPSIRPVSKLMCVFLLLMATLRVWFPTHADCISDGAPAMTHT